MNIFLKDATILPADDKILFEDTSSLPAEDTRTS